MKEEALFCKSGNDIIIKTEEVEKITIEQVKENCREHRRAEIEYKDGEFYNCQFNLSGSYSVKDWHFLYFVSKYISERAELNT